MEKLFIKNRKGLKMVVIVDEAENKKGLVFLMHGFLSFKEHLLLRETAKIFKNNNFTTVLFDATNSLGESEGKMEEGTTTGYFEDLEDVIDWAQKQKWYDDKFFLVGHSMGSYCIAKYAAQNKNVKSLILFSPKVLGEIFEKTDEMKIMIEEWKEKGFIEWESHSSPGVIKRKGYKYFEDGINHNLLKIAENIKCPVLIISGEEDEVIPIEQQKMLFDKITSKKEIYIFKNGDHNLIGKENSEELYNIINNWIKS
jgi:alpha-beta hydrolase superfamily lysophospholipase